MNLCRDLEEILRRVHLFFYINSITHNIVIFIIII